MTAGDSGGPWLTGFSPQTGTGTITAVTAYKLSGDLQALYGDRARPDRARPVPEAPERPARNPD